MVKFMLKKTQRIFLNIKILIIISILLTPCFCYSEWNKQDTILETTWLIIHIIDYRQTLFISDNYNKYYERNPILGKYPSKDKINYYMLTTGLIHPVVSYILPKKYRTMWQGITILGSGYCVLNNYSIGIKMEF